MWLTVLLLAVVFIYAVFKAIKFKGSDSPIIETPLDILKKRCSKKQFGKDKSIQNAESDRKVRLWKKLLP